MNRKEKFICLIGDIIGSKISQDVRILNVLPRIFKKLNSQMKPLVPFNVASGDEFQGLLRISQNPFIFIDYLEGHLFPLRFRTGMGIGSITTDIRRTTQTMRGPVFELAREAIQQAKNEDRFYVIKSNDVVYLLDDILKLLSFIKKKWDAEMVFRRYSLYQKHGIVKRVAQVEKVSAEAVNKFAHNYGFREISSIVKDFHKAILGKAGKG